MTSSRTVALAARPPRLRSVPPYSSTAGDDAIDLCAAVGINLLGWQQAVLRDALGETPDGQWTAFEVGLVVPRQNGKGEVLLARQLAGLFLFGEQLIMHSAHEYKTAAEAFQRIKILIENTDDLIKRCKKPRTANGEQGIELLNGNRLRFVARSGGSGRGFSADCVILDEAYELGPAQMAAMLPTLSSRPNPQIWYASSAGMESSTQLRAVRERGITGSDPALAYMEFSADPRDDLDDRDVWLAANPSAGELIPMEFIERERNAMPEAEFGRERLGIWDDARRAAVIPFDVWESVIDRASAAVDPVTFAFDVAPDRSSAAIGAAGRRADGLWHVEVVEARFGTSWVVDRLVDLFHRWSPGPLWLDAAGPAGSFLPTLTEAGIATRVVTAREVAQGCGAFYDAVMAEKLRHIDQTPLTAAVHGARQRPLGDSWAWNRKDAATDISPLVAVTLAMLGHAETAASAVPVSSGRGRAIALM